MAKVLFSFTDYATWIRSIVITPDGKKTIFSFEIIKASFEIKRQMLIIETGERIFNHFNVSKNDRPPLHSQPAKSLAISPDGKKLVSGCDNGGSLRRPSLKLWDVDTGKLISTFNNYCERVRGITITPNGNKIVSASEDNTLKIWNLHTGKELCSFSGDSYFNCCAVSPDDINIFAGDNLGQVHFLRLEGKSGH